MSINVTSTCVEAHFNEATIDVRDTAGPVIELLDDKSNKVLLFMSNTTLHQLYTSIKTYKEQFNV